MRQLVLITFFIQVLAGQQAIRVTNAASHGFGSAPAGVIALGSLIDVQIDFQGGPIAPIDPATVNIQVQPVGSVQVMGASGPLGVLGLLSKDVPLGPATLTMLFNGQISAPVGIMIVQSNFGLFTRNNGLGPVLAPNSLTHPAKPGDFVTLWGTGLGPAAPNGPVASILLGGHPVMPSYAGPAPGLQGTDQINFQMPDDPAVPKGCFVEIAVQAGAYTSNLGTLSTSPDGGACQSPLGFTAAQLEQLDAGYSVFLGQISLYDMVGNPLSPDPFFSATGFTRIESADAMFMSLDAAGVAQLVPPLRAEDTAYGCSQIRVAGAFLSFARLLSAGNKVTLSTDGSSLDLVGDTTQFPTLYQAQLPQPPLVDSPDAVPSPFFAPGNWHVSVPGSPGVQPFTGDFSVPPPVRITNAGGLATIDATQDLTIGWNGADYGDGYTAMIQLISSNSGLICAAPASAGIQTIPSALLQSSPEARLELLLVPKSGSLTILTVPLTNGSTMPVLVRYYPSEVIPVKIR